MMTSKLFAFFTCPLIYGQINGAKLNYKDTSNERQGETVDSSLQINHLSCHKSETILKVFPVI